MEANSKFKLFLTAFKQLPAHRTNIQVTQTQVAYENQSALPLDRRWVVYHLKRTATFLWILKCIKNSNAVQCPIKKCVTCVHCTCVVALYLCTKTAACPSVPTILQSSQPGSFSMTCILQPAQCDPNRFLATLRNFSYRRVQRFPYWRRCSVLEKQKRITCLTGIQLPQLNSPLRRTIKSANI